MRSRLALVNPPTVRFAQQAREHLGKARDACLLAVEFYNKPAIRFRSGGYITMMSIAWTSLFHAIFFQRKIKPFYRLKDNHTFDIRDGDYRYWELGTCADEFYGGREDPVKANIKFFIPLRNRIEHRSMPKIDGTIFAECQALLLNFDDLVLLEFGEKHALRESLSFSLQLFPKASLADLEKPRPDEKDVLSFIENYRSSLSGDLYSHPKFAFKAFLIRVGNHDTSDSLPIKFFDYEALDEKQKEEIHKFVALIKHKNVPVSNADLYKPGDVVKLVQAKLGNRKVRRFARAAKTKYKDGDRFNEALHTHCWKNLKVRPPAGSKTPDRTDARYCIYDKLNKNYGFTQQWIALLVDIVGNDAKYLAMFAHPELIEILPPNRAEPPHVAEA
jgi:hypothetical protein